MRINAGAVTDNVVGIGAYEFTCTFFTDFVANACVSARTAVIFVTRKIEAFVTADIGVFGANTRAFLTRLIGETRITARTAMILVGRIIDAFALTNLRIGRTNARACFTSLIGEARVTAGTAVLRIALEIDASTPTKRRRIRVRIVTAIDFGWRANAFNARLGRRAFRVAISAMQNIRSEVHAHIEGFTLIGSRTRTDAFTVTIDARFAIGTGVTTSAAVCSIRLDVGADAIAATRRAFTTAGTAATFGSVVTAGTTVAFDLRGIITERIAFERGCFATVGHIAIAIAVSLGALTGTVGTIGITATHVTAGTAVFGINLFVNASTVTDFHARRARIGLTIAIDTDFVIVASVTAGTTIVM